MNMNTIQLIINQFTKDNNYFLDLSFQWKSDYEKVEYEIFGDKGTVYKGMISSIVSSNNFNQIFKIKENEHLSIKYIIEDEETKHYIVKFLNDYTCYMNKEPIKREPEKFVITTNKNISLSIYDENEKKITREEFIISSESINIDNSENNENSDSGTDEDDDIEEEQGEKDDDEDSEDSDEENTIKKNNNYWKDLQDKLENSDDEDSEDSDDSEDTEDIINMSNISTEEIQGIYA